LAKIRALVSNLPVILSAFADNITHAIKEKTFLFYPFYIYILIFIEIGGIKNSFQTSKYKKREVRSLLPYFTTIVPSIK